MFFSKSRGLLETIEEGMPIVYDRRMITFESNLDHALVISYWDNNCLYIFDEKDGPLNPNIRRIDPQLTGHLSQDQIIIDSERFSNWPDFFDPIDENNSYILMLFLFHQVSFVMPLVSYDQLVEGPLNLGWFQILPCL